MVGGFSFCFPCSGLSLISAPVATFMTLHWNLNNHIDAMEHDQVAFLNVICPWCRRSSTPPPIAMTKPSWCSSRGVLDCTTDPQHLRCVSPNMIELKNQSCKCVLSGIEHVLMCYSYPNLDCNIRCFLGSLSKAIDIDAEHYAKSPLNCLFGLWILFSASVTACTTTPYIGMYVDSGACCFMGLMAPSI